MANKSFDSEGLQFAWDATSYETALACPRKYQYFMLENWRSAAPSPHLKFGWVYASALELYHKSMAIQMTHDDAVRKSVRFALEATWEGRDKCPDCDGRGWFDTTDEMRQQMAWAGTVEQARTECNRCEGYGFIVGTGHAWVSGHNTKTRENLIRTIVWYLEHYKDSAISTVILGDGRPAVELSFAFPVDDNLIYTGHMDRVVEYAGDQYVQDQKTTGRTAGPYYFEEFDMSTQMSGYTFVGKALFKLPIKGILIDVAEVMVGFTRFTQGFTHRTEEQLNEWYQNFLYYIGYIRELTRKYRQTGEQLPMNTSACNNYGGCPFRGVCSRPPGVRLQFLKADFEQTSPPWDPLEKR